MNTIIFRNRQDAAQRLAEQLRPLELVDPLVLGIPRGGVAIAAVLARELGCDMDVVLARKLRAPAQPELAVGAVSESGEIFLNRQAELLGISAESDYLRQERQQRLSEIAQRRQRFRRVRPQAPLKGRSVIITDDGIATGSTMLAAIRAVRAEEPHEIILAVPVAPPERLDEIAREADRCVCLETPELFMAIGQFYQDFEQVDDETVTDLLREFAPASHQETVDRQDE